MFVTAMTGVTISGFLVLWLFLILFLFFANLRLRQCEQAFATLPNSRTSAFALPGSHFVGFSGCLVGLNAIWRQYCNPRTLESGHPALERHSAVLT